MGNIRGTIVLILKILIAFILPPAAVLIETGCSWALLLNVILTILGWIPGIIHALLVIFEHPYVGFRRV